MIPVREFLAYVVLASFLGFMLSCSVWDGPSRAWETVKPAIRLDGVFNIEEQLTKDPDFSNYRPIRTLAGSEFPLDEPQRRTIIVGDIHGKIHPFKKLLSTVAYDSKVDVLVHTGDFMSKSSIKDSLAVLSFMTQYDVVGVRGNHEQKIIEWRGWITWICSSYEGCRWLRHVEHEWERARHNKQLTPEEFIDSEKQSFGLRDKRWWKLVPVDWLLFGEHYQLARAMSETGYQYLLRLPLRLHIPSAHTFVVHAGLLPSDPRYPYFDAIKQPLARIPKTRNNLEMESADWAKDGNKTERLRMLQEMAVMAQIPQNMNPWVVLNMRSVKNGKVSRKPDGKNWYKIWDKEMTRCVGFHGEMKKDKDVEASGEKKRKHDLPCYPASVFYGHFASQGLTINRWSFGLDSGCVYGRQLSAFVIGGPTLQSFDDGNDSDDTETSGKKKQKNADIFKFGDRSSGQLVSVNCRT
ncbi:calcineurin-like phosphoesterase [Coprinopsis marcescibilis]|uniref:Calcineurin-like phosphoesterase n=1 Tax=Coprinopsis marcescibilis TaxID=230819 RepID=A0A5C3L394_COPMA|nr:calcineurin-like phosphoesterase [Coprinopsis marcescibilis]